MLRLSHIGDLLTYHLFEKLFVGQHIRNVWRPAPVPSFLLFEAFGTGGDFIGRKDLEKIVFLKMCKKSKSSQQSLNFEGF
jgi:hypothetical protein